MWKEDIVKEACERFQGTVDSLKLLGGFYDNVYEYERDGESNVLKLIPFATKDRNLIYSELQWVSYLRTKGISIPRQILSGRGQTVEVIQRLPVPCCAISFKKAEGTFVDPQNEEEWNPSLFRRWGQLIGKMHALSRKFHQRQNVPPFEEWDEGEIYYRDLSIADPSILDRWNYYLEKIKSFPQTTHSYGLIHNDLHHRNFLVSESGSLTIFDFTHVKYHWFTYDIAIALYHALESVEPQEKDNFYKQFLFSFMSGYNMEHQLEDGWYEQVNIFVEYHLVFKYLYLLTFLPMEKASKEQKLELTKLEAKLKNEELCCV